ncbi:MAG TPA: ADP-ribosylglycohydrolase family protein [Halothiobacillaceae bacterium]|nr:ADP-ribosylglycohydrolase family protein [Halothiobacillaceae bacterium]
MQTDRIRDRAVGALLGLAVGDAVGTTLEFTPRDTYGALTDMVGGGPFRLEAGQWTDDTSMALCLADSLIEKRGLDRADLMERFVRWWQHGENSANGRCFDIGGTTSQALSRFMSTGDPVAGSTDPRSAGNGSIMRLAPVAIFHCRSSEEAQAAARAQSATTHGAPAAVDACAFLAMLLVGAINGAGKQAVLAPAAIDAVAEIRTIAAGSWRAKERHEISSSGYVVHTLEAALWAVDRSETFDEAVLLAANLGDDADTVAAVTGQIAGALWGASGIPQRWRDRLAWHDHIAGRASDLLDAGTR